MLEMTGRIILYILLSISALLLGAEAGYAQSHTLSGSKALDKSETFTYDVHFKLGIVRGKVGQAAITNKSISSGRQYFSQLRFRTTGVGSLVFPTKDTLETLYSDKGLPLRYERRGTEKSTYLKEEITFTYQKAGVYTRIHSVWGPYTLADTAYMVPSEGVYVLDLVSTLALVRCIDSDEVSKDTVYKIALPLGNSVVYGDVRFDRIDEVRMPSGEKVPAICLVLNIRDKVFDTQRNSVEVFLSKDDRLLPLLIRAKLKIGYAECTLKDYHIADN